MMKLPLIPALLLALMLTACGEFHYKRGASASDLSNAKKACESKSDAAAVDQCLEANGWTVQKLEDIDLFATASSSSDNRKTSDVYNMPVPASAPTSSAAATSAQGEAGKSPENNAPAKPVVPAAKPADPMDIFIINSWWKIGSSAASLQADIDQCVATLGEPHRPNAKTQETTRGMLICMREKGWRGLRSK